MEDENEDIIMNGNGMGNGVIPERRHSSTEGSRSSRGEVVTVRLNRRHSLPGGSSGSGGTETSSGGSEGCVIEIHGDRETGSEGSAEVICTYKPKTNNLEFFCLKTTVLQKNFFIQQTSEAQLTVRCARSTC